MLSDELNNAGLDLIHTLRHDVAIPWNPSLVKELLWKKVQKAQLGKRSTTKLTTKEIDIVFETLNRHLGEKLGVHVDFPSEEGYDTQTSGSKLA
jgi:hypothetical protein